LFCSDSDEVAVVYYRAGYSPEHYTSEEVFRTFAFTWLLLTVVLVISLLLQPCEDPGGDRRKIYESNFIHHDFLQFGKQH